MKTDQKLQVSTWLPPLAAVTDVNSALYYAATASARADEGGVCELGLAGTRARTVAVAKANLPGLADEKQTGGD